MEGGQERVMGERWNEPISSTGNLDSTLWTRYMKAEKTRFGQRKETRTWGRGMRKETRRNGY